MKHYFSLCALAAATMFVSTAHSMEAVEDYLDNIVKPAEDNPIITPDSFTKEGKEYMGYAVDLWVEAAQQGDVTTGLASIFKDIKKEGIERLINDEIAMYHANIELNEMMAHPAFKILCDLGHIGSLKYEGTKQLQADLARVVTQAVATQVLMNYCSDFKMLPTNLIQVFAETGQESIPNSIKVLKINDDLNVIHDDSYVRALVLVIGYLEQTSGAGR